MINYNSDGSIENEWDEPGDLAWREVDWELYLDEQDESIRDYLTRYDSLMGNVDRLDEVARLMGWEQMAESAEEAGPPDRNAPPDDDSLPESGWEPYTLHKNPVYISTKALYLGLTKTWEQLASSQAHVPPPLGIVLLATLNRGYEQSLLAIQALDLGDYGLAVCLFKRALRELNLTLGHIESGLAGKDEACVSYREYALPRLFDLREIWLRVMNECREELGPDPHTE